MGETAPSAVVARHTRRKFPGPGRRRSRCPSRCRYAAQRNVTATREAIPLNRRLRNKATRGQQARTGPERPM